LEAKVVQGERSGKGRAEGFFFSLPGRRLLYAKVVQGERSGKGRTEGCFFSLPGRRLLYAKVVQDVYIKRKSERFSAHFAGIVVFFPHSLSDFGLCRFSDLFKIRLSFHLESSNENIQ